MKTKEIVNLLKYNELIPREVDEEIIQRLYQLDELRLLAQNAVDPLIELYDFLIGLAKDFQEGDIDYGRNK
jgi:hypothetical protein